MELFWGEDFAGAGVAGGLECAHGWLLEFVAIRGRYERITEDMRWNLKMWKEAKERTPIPTLVKNGAAMQKKPFCSGQLYISYILIVE